MQHSTPRGANLTTKVDKWCAHRGTYIPEQYTHCLCDKITSRPGHTSPLAVYPHPLGLWWDGTRLRIRQTTANGDGMQGNKTAPQRPPKSKALKKHTEADPMPDSIRSTSDFAHTSYTNFALNVALQPPCSQGYRMFLGDTKLDHHSPSNQLVTQG